MSNKTKTVGVIMLETNFPRLAGDIGNPDGFAFPLLYEIVAGATPIKAVEEQAESLLEPYVQAAHRLVERGADIITTSCGFLACFQSEIQSELDVPVYASSLLLLHELEKRYGVGKVGVLTISKSAMSDAFLSRAGVAITTPIGSPEEPSEFRQAILSNLHEFDVARCQSELIGAAQALQGRHPKMQALLLECTNMAPHSAALGQATGLPIYSLNSLLASKTY